MNIEAFSICGPVNGCWKSHAICAHDGALVVPIAYISRPKWITDDDKWREIVRTISLSVLAGTEIS